jgi:aminocarboxymuconate-semialdehyde decarboxylase
MRVDVHAHYFPKSYAALLAESGRPDLAFVGQADDLDERLAEMDKAGVDVQVLSAVGPNLEVPEASAALHAARFVNDAYAGISARYGGRFRAFGHVPLPHVEQAVEETERCLGELGLLGVALPCTVGGIPIDDPVFEPFWQAAARHDAVVYVHPVGTNSACHPGLADWGLHTAYGSPLQIAVAPVRTVFSGLTFRHPTLRFVFAMCGGVLPFLWPRHERNLRRGIEMSAVRAVGGSFFAYLDDLPIDRQDPMGALKRFWYDTAVQDIPAAMLVAKETYGVERMVLGSDAVFASLAESVTYIEDSPYLTGEEKTAILDRNAQALLGL